MTDTTTNSRRYLGWLAAIVVVAFVAFGLWLAARPPADLVQGMADADSIKVAAKITGRVARLHVHEGDAVEAGQVLFELASPEVEAKVRQATALLDAAQAQASKAEEGARAEEIRAAEANWRRAKAAADLAASTLSRIENLYREGVVTLQRRDEVQAQARSASQAEAAARAQYDLALAGARKQDREAAQAQVRQAEGGVAEVEAFRAEIEGVAPAAGEVSKRLADVGELVPAGYPVFSLIDLNRVWVAFHLREDQFKSLAVGRSLKGRIPALDDAEAEFEVYFINPAGEYATWRATRQSAGYDVKSFEVRARPVQAIPGFRPGMSVLFDWPQA
jgi:HlyD family secretion protein